MPSNERSGLKRHVPRRLFSPDSARSTFSRRSRRTTSEASSANDSEAPEYAQSHPTSPPLPLQGLTDERDSDNVRLWANAPLVASPRSMDPQMTPDSAGHFRAATSPTSSDGLTSPSRWGTVRHHVLPEDAISHQKSATSGGLTSPSSSLNFTPTSTPGKNQPSKSRFAARLVGFRQVAETAREIALDDNVKFATELLKACNAAYFIDPSKHKADSHYMHMMSTTSLSLNPVDMSAAVVPDPFTGRARKPTADLRRPPSVQSLNALHKPVPSLKPLYQTIHKYSTLITNGSPSFLHVPYESQVLSSLLTPFLDLDKATPRLEEERNLAYETFDMLTHTWKPGSELDGINRCLWCCQSAVVKSASRSSILQCLWRLLVHESIGQCRVATPKGLKTLLLGLIDLQASLHDSEPTPNDSQDQRILEDILSKVVDDNCCTDIEDRSLEEEYNALWLDNDDKKLVNQALLLDSFAACVECGLNRTRRVLLRHYLERYWPLPDNPRYSPLLTMMRSRILSTFTRASLSMIPLPRDSTYTYSHLIVRTITSRILPELEAISQATSASKVTMQIQHNVVNIVFKVWTLKDVSMENWASKTLHSWYQHDPKWKAVIERALNNIMQHGEWSRILEILPMVLNGLHDLTRKPMVATILPLLYDRIVEAPPPVPCEILTASLNTISTLYPPAFYKPLFACAASSKEITIANHAGILAGISKFVENFWTKDAEMMCVALTSDAKQTVNAAGNDWTQGKIGQSVLIVEMIHQVQKIRHAKESILSPVSDASLAEPLKFFTALETRLGILLEAKEKTVLVSPSQRLFYAVLFREIRLLTRSTKRANWLPRIISWFTNYHLDDDLAKYMQQEIEESISQIQSLFASAIDGIRTSSHRRSTLALSKGTISAPAVGDEHAITSFFTQKSALLSSLQKGFPRKALKLFVTLAPMLTVENLKKLGPLIWDQHLDEAHDPSAVCAAVFLIMQCAERIPRDLITIIEVDFRSSDEYTRLSAVKRISVLLDFRHQLASQQVVAERSHRLFRLARSVLPFVQTDMGTTEAIPEESLTEEEKMPTELRKRLAEIGWAEEAKAVDPRMHWIQTPMTLLPSHQIAGAAAEQANTTPLDRSVLKEASDVTALLRRNSSTGGPIYGVKRRPIFVPTLATILPRMALLAFDPNLAIATTVKKILLDLLRNDPVLLTRPIHEKLAGDLRDLQMAMSAFRALLHVRRKLPPASTHDMFNYLAGFLKYETKLTDNHIDVLHDFAYVLPVVAQLTSQVGEMSTREFRRAKLDYFFIPSGSLYFSDAAPEGAMFPRRPTSSNRSQLLALALIRTSQNIIFYNILKHNPQDVHHLRRNFAILELPADDNYTGRPLQIKDFTPHRSSATSPLPKDPTLVTHSLMLSRSYLRLVGQIFRCLSRHLNDKDELAILVDGVNRTLMVHGNDLGIVSLALVALMIASVRFRRLLTSGGSYALFMPAILKVYAEAALGSGIRLAIEYACIQFYALHRDAFIFQTLVILAEAFSVPRADCEWLGQNVFTLTSAMMKGVDASTPDPAGIHDVNRSEEREALIAMTAEEKPQTLLAALRQGGSQVHPQDVDFTEETETSKLSFDNIVRLFLTVIAHDHTILRAQQFLKFLRFLTPHLYAVSSASRAVLQEGIDALGAILVRAILTRGKESLDPLLEGAPSAAIKLPSDITVMRMDYLFLISAFCRAGGVISPPTIRQALSIVVLVQRDASHDNTQEISSFISELCSHVLLRPDRPPVKYINYFLKDASSVIKAVSPLCTVDFSPLFNSVLEMVDDPRLANDRTFANTVTEVLCPAALESCQASSVELVLHLLPWTPSLVKLLSRTSRLPGGNVLTGVEQSTPSYQFLACIVQPLVLQLPTGPELKATIEPLDASACTVIAANWFRLLAYAMSACIPPQPSRKEKASERRKRDTDPSARVGVATVLMALQVIKVIIVRGDSDLGQFSSGIWHRLSAFLIRQLEKGGTKFAISSDRSPFASPLHSPKSSVDMSADFSPRPSNTQQPLRIPSLSDYTLWSWLELITIYRNPLVPHLRTLVQEKVFTLNQELQQSYGGEVRRDRSSFLGSRRVTSTIFTKPRKHLSGLPSPNGSPYLGPSMPGTPRHSIEFGMLPEPRQAGWAMTGTSPSKNPYPQIVHLGPASPLDLGPSMKSWGERHESLDPSVTVRSLSLIHKTYHRIRTVQSCLGYELLLPLPDGTTDRMPGGDDAGGHIFTGSWNKTEALRCIVQETKELMGEFEEAFSFGLGDESLQYVNDADLSFTVTHPL